MAPQLAKRFLESFRSARPRTASTPAGGAGFRVEMGGAGSSAVKLTRS